MIKTLSDRQISELTGEQYNAAAGGVISQNFRLL